MTRLLILCAALSTLAAGCVGNHALGTNEIDVSNDCCYDQLSQTRVASCTGASCICSASLCSQGAVCQMPSDCPKLGVACFACSDGSTVCPAVDCVSGQCIGNVPACPAVDCNANKPCPAPPAGVCEQCADGSCAGYASECTNGKCVVTKTACPQPAQCHTPTSACVAPACPGLCPYGSHLDPNGCATCSCLSKDETATSPAGLCVPPTGSCVTCSDGSTLCAVATCDGNVCKVTYPSCPPPSGACQLDHDCPQPQIACTLCADGTTACPRAWCDKGVCQAAFPTCPPQCTMPKDCPQPAAPCTLCKNGTEACPSVDCVKGMCVGSFPTCPPASS